MTTPADGALPDNIVSTAPERIWLDLGEQLHLADHATTFADLAGAVTWSDDNATGCGIEYVRADRATRAEPVAVVQPVAWVPVHPRNGPLWANATAEPNSERLPSYPLMPLYAAPPVAARDPRDVEAWTALGFLSGLHPCMTIDGDRPMAMAEAIFESVQAEIKRWRAEASTATNTLVELAQSRAEIARWRIAQEAIPEGCTPADARVLREANHALAVEVQALRVDAERYRAIKIRHASLLVSLATGSFDYSSATARGIIDSWADAAVRSVQEWDAMTPEQQDAWWQSKLDAATAACAAPTAGDARTAPQGDER